MLATESYQLWYTGGVPHHELKGFHAVSESRANANSMAEYLLAETRYATQPRSAVASYRDGQAVTAYRSGTRQPIEAIHAACKGEIESYWQQPQLSEQEFYEGLFADKLSKELEKIPKSIEVMVCIKA